MSSTIFANKVAWITGASSGIGRALALELAREGASVVVSARRTDRLAQLVKEIQSSGGKALAFVCDVTDRNQVFEVANHVVENYGRLDIVVANAGLAIGGPFEELTGPQWKNQLDVNVLGVVSTLAAALPYLKKVKGRAVVISSVSGKLSSPKSSAYCASKAALCGLCDSLYQELWGTGVSITNVLPGIVESEIDQVDNEGMHHPDRKDRRPRSVMWPTDRAARAITKAIYKRKRQAVITKHGKFAVFLGQHLPGLTYALMARIHARRKNG